MCSWLYFTVLYVYLSANTTLPWLLQVAELKVCVLSKLTYCKPNSQHDCMWSKEVIKVEWVHEHGPWIYKIGWFYGINVFVRKYIYILLPISQSSCPLDTLYTKEVISVHRKKAVIYDLRAEHSSDNSVCTLIWYIQSPEL